MADDNRCPRCGALCEASSPTGLCPRCLLLIAAAAADETGPPLPGAVGSGHSLEATEPDPEMTRARAEAPDPSTAQDRARAASDLTASAAGASGTIDGNGAPRDLTPGVIVCYFGDYEVKKELGRGGMGVVYHYAGCHAKLSALAGLAGSGVSGDESDVHADRAIALLRQAVEMGYRNAGVYRSETALEPLRGRDDFQLLLLDLAFPRDPFAR